MVKQVRKTELPELVACMEWYIIAGLQYAVAIVSIPGLRRRRRRKGLASTTL